MLDRGRSILPLRNEPWRSGQVELPERTTAQVEPFLPNDPNHLKELLSVCGRVTIFDYENNLKQ